MPKGPIDGDQVYEAERLLDKRILEGQVQYFIKWKGWPNKFNTWEPEENILDKTLVTMYEHYQSLDIGPSSSNRSKRKTTPETSPIKLRKRSIEDLDSSSPSKLRRSIRSNKSSKNLSENADEEEDEYLEKKNRKKKNLQKTPSSAFTTPSGEDVEPNKYATTSDTDKQTDQEQDLNESVESASTADESEKSVEKPKASISRYALEYTSLTLIKGKQQDCAAANTVESLTSNESSTNVELLTSNEPANELTSAVQVPSSRKLSNFSTSSSNSDYY